MVSSSLTRFRTWGVATAALAVVLVGCGGGDGAGGGETPRDTQAPTSDAPASEPTSEPASAPASEPTSAAPTETGDTSGDDLPAVFVDLPEGYSYTEADPDIERDLRSQLESGEAAQLFTDIQAKAVTKGSVPVALVMVIGFDDAATTADKAAFGQGFLESAQGEPESIQLAGQDATFVEAGDGAKAILFLVEDVAISVFGDDRAELETVATALIEGNAGA